MAHELIVSPPGGASEYVNHSVLQVWIMQTRFLHLSVGSVSQVDDT